MEELKPIHSGQKSFWGLAHVKRFNSTGAVHLVSYTTYVCCVDAAGRFHRTWDGWSRTTMKHIVEFVRQFVPGGPLTKKEWEALPVEDPWLPAHDTASALLSTEAK